MCRGTVEIFVKFVVVQILLVLGAPPMAKPRLSLVDWNNYNYHEPNGPGTYAFGYDIEDPDSDNVQFRNEERHPNGTITGSYGYVDPEGVARITHYTADTRGYRAKFEESPLKYLKPLLLPGIRDIPHLSENPEQSKQLGKIVTPDNFGQYQIGSGNQLQSGFAAQNYFPQGQNYFPQGQNYFPGSFGFNRYPDDGQSSWTTTTEAIWPGFDVASLFNNRIGQGDGVDPRRTIYKIKN